MKLFAGLEQVLKSDEPLGPYTWLGIGGPAQYFATPVSVEQLAEVLRRCRENEVPVRMLGGGANLLIDDSGIKGMVIKLSGEQFADVSFGEGGLRAGAGADLMRLVLRCVREG